MSRYPSISMAKRLFGLTGALLLALVMLSGSEVPARTYSTQFPLTENPISERGRWTNGRAIGRDWTDVATIPGLAYGTQTGSGGYDDATALLSGDWGPDQSVTATVHSVNQTGGKVYQEVEIRLRSSLSAHRNTGYEINFRCLQGPSAYVQIVRWNGPLGSFTYLVDEKGKGVSDGDVVRATIKGNVITAFINGVLIARATDRTYSSGAPGMGFFLQGAVGVNRDYGFSRITASDGPGG